MEKEIKCKDCGTEFMTSVNARYPRKYCDKCSLERKEAYAKIGEIKFEDCED
jgi:uncharacterized OB-fold protein